jgi:hypothetical protein
MSIARKMKQLGVGEAALSAACWAMASVRSELRKPFARLAEAHRAAAEALGVAGPRMSDAMAAGRALLAAITSPGGAAAWLLAREHALVRAYLALDTDDALDDVARARLRREWLPAAYDRCMDVDRLVARAEPEPAPAC